MAASQQAGTAAAAQAGQQPKAVLCFRKDGLLLTENNTSIVDLYCEVCQQSKQQQSIQRPHRTHNHTRSLCCFVLGI